MNKKPAATYARFSTDLQKDNSIEDQQALCRQYAERNGFEVVRDYADSAKSGASTFGRDGLLDLMADAKAGLFKTVVVESLDRISRDQEDLAGIWKRLSFLGVEIIAVHDGKADQVAIGVRGLLGALYLKDLADKTRRGLAGRIEAGKSAGGKAYGYRPVAGKPGELVIVPEEAEIVRRIFRAYADGKSPRSIAQDLNRDCVPAPRGAAWAANTINGTRRKGTGILRLDLYRGKIVWNKLRYIRDPSTGKRVSRPNPQSEWRMADAPQLRIVDPDLWEKVQARLDNNAKTHQSRRRPQKRRMLSGLIKCGACGSGMAIAGVSRGRQRISCSRFRESGSCEHGRSYYLDIIENGVVSVLRNMMSEPTLTREFLDAYVDERQQEVKDMAKNRSRLENDLAKAASARDRLIKFAVEGVISEEQFRKQKPDYDRRVELAESKLARAAPAAKVDFYPEAIRAYKDAFDRLYEILKTRAEIGKEEIMEPLRHLVHSVVVHPTPPEDPIRVEMFGHYAALSGDGVARTVVAGAGFEPATFRL